MLSVKGIYDGKIIRPLTEVDKKANTLVIITFLEDDSHKNELDLIKDAREKFYQLSKSFNFGDSPDEEYADELMSTYNETLPKE